MSHSPVALDQLIEQGKFDLVESSISEFVISNFEKKFFIKLQVPIGMHSNDPNAYETEVISITAAYATLITKLFCNPNYAPSPSFLVDLMYGKEMFELIFSLSQWKNTDSLIDRLGLMQLTTLKKFQFTNKRRRQFEGLLALFCVGSKYRIPWKLAFEVCPESAIKAYFGLINQSVSLLDKTRGLGYDDLLAAASEFPVLDLRSQETVKSLCQGYFSCSYTNGEKKYEFKKWIARLVSHNSKRWLSADNLAYSLTCHQHQIAEKPKMGIVLELYSKSHAMFRCFNSFFLKLKSEYHLVAYIDDDQAPKADLSAFDEHQIIKPSASLDEVVSQIREDEIDILFFSSVGMKRWSTLLAYIRCAPLQVMAGGHPSSSYSPNMDYFLMIGKGFVANDIQPFIHEQVIKIENQYDNQNYATRHPSLTDELIDEYSRFLNEDDELVVGINGVVMKVSNELVQVCQQISRRINKPVKFIFFSIHIKNHLAYLSTKAQLARYLNNFQLEFYQDYQAYLKTIASCHLLLPTFPFGGSNSNVDAMLLCKPKLFMTGQRELYTRTDEVEWVDTPVFEHFVCEDVEQLIDKSIQLLNDKSLRMQIHDLMKGFCTLDNIFYEESALEQSNGCSFNPHFKEIKHLHMRAISKKGVA
jgi:hypothetical protein